MVPNAIVSVNSYNYEADVLLTVHELSHAQIVLDQKFNHTITKYELELHKLKEQIKNLKSTNLTLCKEYNKLKESNFTIFEIFKENFLDKKKINKRINRIEQITKNNQINNKKCLRNLHGRINNIKDELDNLDIRFAQLKI